MMAMKNIRQHKVTEIEEMHGEQFLKIEHVQYLQDDWELGFLAAWENYPAPAVLLHT